MGAIRRPRSGQQERETHARALGSDRRPRAREVLAALGAGQRRTLTPHCPWYNGGVCLAIPGQIIEIVNVDDRLATVEVAGVRRTVNIGLLDAEGRGVGPGDWVLIHVGFAIARVDEEEARATHDLLMRMGAAYEQELDDLKASVIE